MPFPIPPYAYGNPAAMGGAASTPWIITPGSNSLRSDFTGWVGANILVGAAPINITSLGRIFITGNAQNHDVGIFNITGDPLLIVTVVGSSGTNLEFNYTAGSLTLSAATEYTIASLEANGGDQWIDDVAPTALTAVASITARAFRAGTGTSGAFTGNPGGTIFVPPNFKYSL